LASSQNLLPKKLPLSKGAKKKEYGGFLKRTRIGIDGHGMAWAIQKKFKGHCGG